MSDEAKVASQDAMGDGQSLDRTIVSLLDNMPGMAFTKDVQTGVYLTCNQAFADYAHKEAPAGVVGLTDAQIFDPVTAAHFVEDDQTALSMDRPYIFFEDVPDAAGNQRQLQTTKFTFVDASGNLCLQGLCQDVTDIVTIQREHDETQTAYERVRSSNVINARIAQALARGYTDLFYVNLETGELIEYHTNDELGVLTEARRSKDFFEGCARDAILYVHPDDQETFVRSMSREYLEGALARSNVFEMTYRRIKGDRTFYVQMRVSQVENDKRFVVIAVKDIDELMKKRKAERRIAEERVIYARLHAITGNFICVYVVDPKTGRYREFTASDDYVKSFGQAKEGTDFFATVRDAARIYNHPDDIDRFLSQITADNVLTQIEQDGVFSLSYRVLMDGRPHYVQLTAALVEEQEGSRLIVGLGDIDAQVRQREIDEEIARQKEIYDQITASLAEQYDTLYYIDIESSTYIEISATDEYKKLNVPATGSDFFAESRRSIRKYVHPEDREKAYSLHYKDVMLDNLRKKGTFSMGWRLVVDGQVRHIRHTEIMARDGKHIIVCIKNVEAEVQAELALEARQRKSVTYTQIAERLAAHYDFIYYIDCENSSYTEYSIKKMGDALSVQDEGEDFFGAAWRNAGRLIHADDRERIRLFLDKDNLITELESSRQLVQDYRMVITEGKTQHARMTVTYASDHSHFIICVENRDEYIRKEQEQLAKLSMANELARQDGLTRTKNKTAYREEERQLQQEIDADGECEPFGIVVCDVNGLKVINDTKGHKAGDEFIKASSRIICHTFLHSPVFRVGGDEFAVVLRGQDFEQRELLLAQLRRRAEENTRIGEGPVVASGLAEFRLGTDKTVGEVFDRADAQMYEDKARLKKMQALLETRLFPGRKQSQAITDDRRVMLDALYNAFDTVSEGTYVFLCDMKFDFSRWSKNAVDAFDLPSEYMYGAGDIWENRIHPEDREAYHKGIEELFAGNAAGHDMQYRAQRATGEYDVCTCRGVVIRDPFGEPDYFVGTIRNHSILGHVDSLTGLRNQYGFFEDLESYIKRGIEVSVALLGIAKFSEINEMYGYHFGNRVLQLYAREVLRNVGGMGHVYRIDGTRLAVISSTLSVTEMRVGYNRLRSHLHGGFMVEGRKVLLDIHCGMLCVDSPSVDPQTVYACLNYADGESKLRRHGSIVEFKNDLRGDSHRRLERLHAIRASITHDFEGYYLLYQPVVDATTEELIGAEALLRWDKEPYGMVPPDQFIPILESDPLFPRLGEWIIREAVLAARDIRELHSAFVMNVNLSYTQVEEPGFVDMVLRILKETGYPAEHLCLEVTERCRLLDTELLANVIVQLRSNGVRVALDDFGTGFSSVGILKEVPFDVIKIDRGFVKAIEGNATDRQLVRNIVDLASIFGAKTCVEGVETAGMRDILNRYHVGSFQGYYYAKPLKLEQFLEWETGA